MAGPIRNPSIAIDPLTGVTDADVEAAKSNFRRYSDDRILEETRYGAVLARSGAGAFFINWAFALFGKTPSPSAPGRAPPLPPLGPASHTHAPPRDAT